MWVLYVVAGAVVYLISHILWEFRNKPAPRWSLPIVGDTIPFALNMGFFKRRHELYGPISRANIAGNEWLLVADPEEALKVLHAEGREVHGWVPSFTHALEGRYAFVGKKHAVVRKGFLTMFTTKALSNLFPTLKDILHGEVQSWMNKPGNTLTVTPLVHHLAFAAVYGCLVDLAKARDTTQMGLFETWMKAFCSLPFDLPYSNYRNGMRAHRELKKEISKLFEAQRQIGAANRNGPTSSGSIVVDMMLTIQQDLEEKEEEDIHLDDEELMDTLLVFLMAGHETVISGIVSIMRYLGEHIDIQAKLNEEVKRLSPDGEELTFKQVQSMSYLTAVVKEALRMDPPVSMAMREVIAPIKVGDYQLKEGDMVLIHYESLHRRAFQNPDKFDPTRFHLGSGEYATLSASNESKKHFLAFSAGGRSCVGMRFAFLEMQTLFALLMKEGFKWTLVPNQDLRKVMHGVSPNYGSGVIIDWKRE